MKEIPVSLEGLKKEDIYSVASALLYSLKDSPQYSVTSELFYILDYNNFLKMIQYFGGMEIRVPTISEINEILKVLLLYQYSEVEEINWKDALKKAEISEEESRLYRSKVSRLSKILKSQDLGKRYYD